MFQVQVPYSWCIGTTAQGRNGSTGRKEWRNGKSLRFEEFVLN
jgi:hypothetical protein